VCLPVGRPAAAAGEAEGLAGCDGEGEGVTAGEGEGVAPGKRAATSERAAGEACVEVV
jgi:hypothetical protein